MLSFVLPLSKGKDIYMAINILFPSIIKFFNLSQLCNLFIILNKSDKHIFDLYMKDEYMDKLKIKIIYEDELLDIKNIYNTYYLQMLLKLLVSKRIETDFYLTLDADIYFCKDCDINNFILNNKAYYNKIKLTKKNKWINRVEKELNIDINIETNQTPFIFKTQLVKNMLNSMDVQELIIKKNCSEYTLFLGYLIKNNLLDIHYYNKNFTVQSINYSINKNLLIDNEILLNENFLLNDNTVIGCIQSRINQHKKLIPILKQYIPTITFNKPKIALLTVVSEGEYYNTYENAFSIKANYCNYYNYDFIFDIIKKNKYSKNKGWIKIYKLKEIIKKYDYVFMSDADVIITNRDIMLEDIIYKYELDKKLFLITEDYNSLNSGNIIWRNCPETIEFLDKIINHTKINMYNEPYKLMGIYEQPCIIDLINKEYLEKIKIIPQKILNSYPTFLGNKIDDNAKWSNGNFLIHFAGVNYNNHLWKIFDIVKEVKKYCLIYKINIIKKEGLDYGHIY
jgi:hypothetical protein